MNIIKPANTIERFAGCERIYFVIDTRAKVAYFTMHERTSDDGIVVVDLGLHTYSDIVTFYRYKAKGLYSFAQFVVHGHDEQYHI